MAKGNHKTVDTVVAVAGPKPVPARGFDPLDESNNFNVDRPAYAFPVVSDSVKPAMPFEHYAGHQDIKEGAGEARLMFPRGKE